MPVQHSLQHQDMDFSTLPANHLGLGVNRVIMQADDADFPGLNRAVDGQLAHGLVGSDVRYSICRTASELAQAMQQQSAVSLTGLGFLPLLQAKRIFFRQLKTTVFSLSVLVHSRCITHAASLIEPHLLPGIDIGSLDAFVAAYGDSFVSGVSYGAELIGVYTFRSESRRQVDDLERQLQAGGLRLGLGTPLSAGFTLQDAIAHAQDSSELRVDFHCQAWGARTPAIDREEPDTLVDAALSFASASVEQPVLLGLSTLGYERIPGLNTPFQPVVANRDRFTAAGGLQRQRTRMQELSNQLQDTRETLDLYGINLPDRAEISTALQQVETDLQAYAVLEQAYGSSPSTPVPAAHFPSLEIGSPQIAVSVFEDPATTAGQWDTTKGQPFFFPFSPRSAIQDRVRIAAIALETGLQLDKIIIDYESRQDSQLLHVVHGGDRGNPSGAVTFAAGEGITQISGDYGTGLDRIDLATDRGTIGGGGDRGDTPLNWQKRADQVVIGFAGRSDDNPRGAVYTIRAVVARFQGISWQAIDSAELLDSPLSPS